MSIVTNLRVALCVCARSSNGTTSYSSSLTTMLLHGCTAGAQALVAWSLQQAFPDEPLQMVAEEDAADLRCAFDGTVMSLDSHRQWDTAGYNCGVWLMHPAPLATAGVTAAQRRPWPRASPSW